MQRNQILVIFLVLEQRRRMGNIIFCPGKFLCCIVIPTKQLYWFCLWQNHIRSIDTFIISYRHHHIYLYNWSHTHHMSTHLLHLFHGQPHIALNVLNAERYPTAPLANFLHPLPMPAFLIRLLLLELAEESLQTKRRKNAGKEFTKMNTLDRQQNGMCL